MYFFSLVKASSIGFLFPRNLISVIFQLFFSLENQCVCGVEFLNFFFLNFISFTLAEPLLHFLYFFIVRSDEASILIFALSRFPYLLPIHSKSLASMSKSLLIENSAGCWRDTIQMEHQFWLSLVGRLCNTWISTEELTVAAVKIF